ncbi:nucleotidyl transferase AbiEii/AbiGii toxin family protein [Propionivibrio sp.]|uniref:nucleotidyl transferase AbiEii/AbiGii toxin family protein n=1 Tax=Propionivibrio sp. TaxID=2212460 RepID=UPI00263766C5|nr:nucleotidyl transferase AbiEii/AbiGii toxin family protein [Propionivibrio sp.]
MSGRNLAASIRDRLLNKARAEKLDYNLLLIRYALERMIYRLSISSERDRFLLKGALLFDLWFDVPHRPTHDADFLGFGSAEIPQVEAVFRDICRIEVADGIVFDPDSVKASEIRKEANYAGVRVTLLGMLDKARCPVQADIGFGDAVVPGPDEVDYPVLLAELPAPHLRVYPRYTVVAEKFEALTSLGILNSRMKDYFDLWVLARHSEFDSQILTRAIAATFQRRQTGFPDGVPIGLSNEFASDPQKVKQWNAFLRKNAIDPKPLSEVVTYLREFLMPVLASAAKVQGATEA